MKRRIMKIISDLRNNITENNVVLFPSLERSDKNILIDFLQPYVRVDERNINVMLEQFMGIISSIFNLLESDRLDDLIFVRDLYRVAFDNSKDYMYDVERSYFQMMARSDEKYWTLYSHVDAERHQKMNDIDDYAMNSFVLIGGLIEVVIDPYARKMLDMLGFVLDNKINTQGVKDLKLGQVYHELQQKNVPPNIINAHSGTQKLRLDKWRNISAHHLYTTDTASVLIMKSKDVDSFQISRDELLRLQQSIMMTYRTFSGANLIFQFENIEFVRNAVKDIDIKHRKEALTTRLFSTLSLIGFYVEEIYSADDTINISIVDLKESKNIERAIHASQALPELLIISEQSFSKLTYFDCNHIKIAEFELSRKDLNAQASSKKAKNLFGKKINMRFFYPIEDLKGYPSP